ncbi:hypothetical protein RhiirA5_405543 [Rhizophagus irregularis]|uniref:Uncharacterized protein n=1 Tax=Rhizophagus irregularis TaxID=588596 RepID=A0A2I1EJP2_9GLOM|nr:hypothetical protein RhiirA5_405543 [Rhizophagus irregularis]PKY22351.1 hypothetical protein RhiirB3_436279 [Rhizophagus irregularis]
MAEVFTLSEDDKNLLIAEKAYEKLKINNKQLNDELNSLQIYNHNLEKAIQIPDDVWESLNKRCHEKFDFEDLIKESTEIEELQWAEKTLPSYTIWDKFNLKSGMIKNLFQKSNMQEDDMDLDMEDSESNEKQGVKGNIIPYKRWKTQTSYKVIRWLLDVEFQDYSNLKEEERIKVLDSLYNIRFERNE